MTVAGPLFESHAERGGYVWRGASVRWLAYRRTVGGGSPRKFDRNVIGPARVYPRVRAATIAGLITLCALASSSASAAPLFTPVNGSPFATGAGTPGPASVAFSPSGGLLATANSNHATVSVFSVGTEGVLSPVSGSPFATGIACAPGNGDVCTDPVSVAFSPSGGLLATASDVGERTVSVFSVGSRGALTPVTGSPFATGIGSSPRSVAFSPSGTLLATANLQNDTVSVFSVGSGGTLTPVGGSPFATGSQPNSVAFSPSGTLLATANANANASTISVFSVGSGGALTPVTGSPFATGAGSAPVSVAFSPSGTLLAAANFSGGNAGTVSVFSVGPGGALTPVSGSPFAAGKAPVSVAFSPSGTLLADANVQDDTVSVFSVGQGGALAPLSGSPLATGAAPSSVAFSPSGGLLANANFADATVSMFSSGPSAGDQAKALVTASTGVGPGKALQRKALGIQAAVSGGNKNTACVGITDYLGLVKAQTGKKLTKAQAEELTNLAKTLAATLDC